MSLMPALYWNATATVYTPGTDGDYTVLSKSDLPCRVSTVWLLGMWSGTDPTLNQPQRRFVYPVGDPDYVLPKDCQIVVDGVKWNPMPSSVHDPKPLGTVLYHAIDMVKAE